MKLLTALTVLSALALAGVSGCFGGDSDESTTSEEPRVISQADVKQYAPGSEERVVLDWWREVQYKNAVGARERYHPKVEITVEELNRQVSVVSSQFVGVPEISLVDGSGKVTTVYMQLDAPGSEDAPPRNLSVNLRQQGDEWLLADNLLIEQAIGRVSRALDASD